MDNTAAVPQATSAIDRLKAAYNELDLFMRRALKEGAGTAHRDLIKKLARVNPLFEDGRYDLETYANLRNAVEHNHLPGSPPIAEPRESAVAEYERLVEQLIHPAPALSLAVPLFKIFSINGTEHVRDVVQLMNQRDYTHVPVLENEAVVGVGVRQTATAIVAFQQVLCAGPFL